MDTKGNPLKVGSWYKMNVLRDGLSESHYEKQVKRFGVNTVGILLKKGEVFEYSDGTQPKVFDHPCTFEPVSLFRTLSVTQSYQGTEGTCFAHASSLMIFHNLYKLTLTDKEKRIYIENNCNLHLDTTRKEDYPLLLSQCGEKGSTRILLFLYIYKVITGKFGCDGGALDKGILYYLNTSFQPLFSREINRILLPIHESVNRETFECSMIDIKKLTVLPYKDFLADYFERYYAVADIIEPSHSVTLVGINKFGIVGKDSATSSPFVIPFHEFRSKGRFSIKEDKYKGMDYLYFLYKKSKVYPERIKENTICIDTYTDLKADIEKETEKEMARKTRRVRQEARLEKIVSDALKGGKQTRRVKYGRNDEKISNSCFETKRSNL
jgi:hypothetical protein